MRTRISVATGAVIVACALLGVSQAVASPHSLVSTEAVSVAPPRPPLSPVPTPTVTKRSSRGS
jgi:hypothetical protein